MFLTRLMLNDPRFLEAIRGAVRDQVKTELTLATVNVITARDSFNGKFVAETAKPDELDFKEALKASPGVAEWRPEDKQLEEVKRTLRRYMWKAYASEYLAAKEAQWAAADPKWRVRAVVSPDPTTTISYKVEELGNPNSPDDEDYFFCNFVPGYTIDHDPPETMKPLLRLTWTDSRPFRLFYTRAEAIQAMDVLANPEKHTEFLKEIKT